MMLSRDDLVTLLQELVHSGANELHIKVPHSPMLRVAGRMTQIKRPATSPEYTLALSTVLLSAGGVDGVALASVQHREFGFGVSGLGRFHATLYRQRGSIAIRVTRIPFSVPTLEELGLTDAVDGMFLEPGLNLVCGSARATGLAALVGRYNQVASGVLVSIEDPLSYLHSDQNAVIAQRGVGTDVASIADGVSQAHRQGVDVIVTSDVPDRETAERVLRAAEDGIVIVAGVAAPDANLAASWILRLYDSERDLDVKARLKRLLKGIVSVGDDRDARYVARRSAQKAA